MKNDTSGASSIFALCDVFSVANVVTAFGFRHPASDLGPQILRQGALLIMSATSAATNTFMERSKLPLLR